MSTKNLNRAAVLTLLTLAAACSDSATNPAGDEGLSDADLAALGLSADDLAGQILFGQLTAGNESEPVNLALASDVITTEASFTRTRTCRGGGALVMTGEMTRTRDTETRVVEMSVSGTRTRTDCVHVREKDDGESVSITVNGSGSFEASRRRVNGEFDGLQTSSTAGSFDWAKSTGESGSCEYSLTSVRDPEAGTRTVTGTMCGHEVNRTVDWNQGDG